jgi:hypothetical protein
MQGDERRVLAALEVDERRIAVLEQALRDAEERTCRAVEEPRYMTWLAKVRVVRA